MSVIQSIIVSGARVGVGRVQWNLGMRAGVARDDYKDNLSELKEAG